MLVDKNRTPADVNRVNVSEEWEVRWWCDRFGCTETALRTAVSSAGDVADDVQRELKNAGHQAFRNTGED
jgi:hypothetical protein